MRGRGRTRLRQGERFTAEVTAAGTDGRVRLRLEGGGELRGVTRVTLAVGLCYAFRVARLGSGAELVVLGAAAGSAPAPVGGRLDIEV